jgi:hypothetical protein
MKKSIKVMPKKSRGRPATGKDPQVVLRMPAALIEAVEAWGATNDAIRSEAIRRLLEIGLGISAPVANVPPTSKATAERAKELAGKTIDRLVEPAASAEEKAVRKQRLIKGPSEFREARVDRLRTKR